MVGAAGLGGIVVGFLFCTGLFVVGGFEMGSVRSGMFTPK